MSTFIGQLIGFAVIVFLVVKYVVPPVRTLMAKQQDAVRQQLADSKTAADKLVEAEGAHAKAIEDAKADAAQIAEEAKADAVQISKQLREQADAEVERIKVHGQEQIVLQRQQLIRQLRGDLGAESVRRAGDLVRSHVADPSAQSATSTVSSTSCRRWPAASVPPNARYPVATPVCTRPAANPWLPR